MRTTRRSLALFVGALLVTGACGGEDSPATQPAPSITGPTQPSTTVTTASTTSTSTTRPPDPCAVGGQGVPPDRIAANFPTALAFAPDGRLFYAERGGTVRVFQDGATRPFATVQTVTTEAGGGYSERGLLGLAVSPTFASDRFVYAFYSMANRSRQAVIRWTDCAGESREPTVIVELPSGGDCCHKGGRLAFGPDGKLYVTLGDQHAPAAAADASDVRGKVLRYNPDGTVPADNPFGTDNPVWASGFRNPFGLAISAGGRVAVTSNGPSGDAGSPASGYDIVATNVTRASVHQWPACYGYSHPIRGATCTGTEPEWSSEARAVVPTGATFVNGSGPAPYADKLVFCTLNEGMKVLTDGTPHASVADGDERCTLDVEQAPDTTLWVADTDAIHRIR